MGRSGAILAPPALRLVWLVVLLAGCPSGGGGSFEAVSFTPAAIPGVGTVSFTTEATGPTHVVFGLAEDALDEESPTVDASVGAVELRGLRLGQKHFAKVVVGEEESDVIEFTIDPPPGGVPAFNLNAWDPSKSCLDGGYVLFSYLGQQKSGVGIVTREAKYVWAVASDDGGMQIGRARPGRDGQSVIYNRFDEAKAEDLGEIVRVSVDGAATTRTRTLNAHHDFVELPDQQTFAWLAYDRRTVNTPPAATVTISAEAIYEGPEGLTDENEGDAVQVWNQWDDYPQGVYALPEEADEFLQDGSLEAAHGNSIVYRESDDSYIVGWRWLDTVLNVGRDGALAWQWGGPYNELSGDAGDLFVHSHFSDAWDGGILMFDNRLSPEISRMVEYSLDESTDPPSFALTWEQPSDSHDDLLGDVRRMPIDGCDNVLVSFSQQGRMVELTRDGEIAWDIGASGIGNVISRIFFVPDLYDLNSSKPY